MRIFKTGWCWLPVGEDDMPTNKSEWWVRYFFLFGFSVYLGEVRVM